MKILFSVVLMFLAGAAGLPAQVSVELLTTQTQYIPGEAIPVLVRISNQSGQTLTMGQDNEWLTVSVEARDGSLVPRLAELPVEGQFTLESSQLGKKVLDIAPGFDLTRQGNYNVTATVKLPQWQRWISSSPLAISIIKANTIWEQECGVPGSNDGSGAPEVRKFALQQANYMKNLRLYVRITDASGTKIFKLINVGSQVSFNTPEAQIDKTSRLHLLHQTGAKSFCYAVISPNGDLEVLQTHDFVSSRPRLRKDTEGRILVSGGARRMTPQDIPAMAPDFMSSTNVMMPTNSMKLPKP